MRAVTSSSTRTNTAIVIKYPLLCTVGSDSQIQTFAIGKAVLLVFGLGVINLSRVKGLSDSGHF